MQVLLECLLLQYSDRQRRLVSTTAGILHFLSNPPAMKKWCRDCRLPIREVLVRAYPDIGHLILAIEAGETHSAADFQSCQYA
jgi:hypothetical protein